MKLPDCLFPFVNRVMRALLCSPLHGIFSDSILLIRFTGRVSGKRLVTPLRYMRDGDTIVCFSARETRWWRNIERDTPVTLRLHGEERRYRATRFTDDAERMRAPLLRMLALFPEDAPYHHLTLDRNGKPHVDQFESALRDAVMIVATPDDVRRS